MAAKYAEDNQLEKTPPMLTQRQSSDPRNLTTCFLLFENAGGNEICFREYRGTHSRYHSRNKMFLPQMANRQEIEYHEPTREFADYIERVLNEIPSHDLPLYTVSIRTGVLYFFSRRFMFKQYYTMDTIRDVLQKKIPLSNDQYYFPPRANANPSSDDTLRSSFCTVKPINKSEKFVEELREHQFIVKEQKYIFRLYLQSDDKQTHVCVIDPTANYSIIEFTKDFQRTSNIDFIRDRHSSQYHRTASYDDVFDYRIQFQYNPRTRSDQLDTIVYELRQQFPNLNESFCNENLLTPLREDDKEMRISEQLCPYVTFLRRDFGDIYHYEGEDELFQNFTIYLESSVEYAIDRQQAMCKPSLDTHGLVYARLDLATMTSANHFDRKLLIEKLWDMGMGLTTIVGTCTTSETQQGTNYYAPNGDMFTAEDEALVQRILKGKQLHFMLGLPHYARTYRYEEEYDKINNRLLLKWSSIRSGPLARDKLREYYECFINRQS